MKELKILMESLLDWRKQHRLSLVVGIWFCDFGKGFGKIGDFLCELESLFKNGEIVLEIFHEKLYILKTQHSKFFIPLKLLTKQELKCLYNLIYKKVLIIKPTEYDFVEFYPLKIDFYVLMNRKMYFDTVLQHLDEEIDVICDNNLILKEKFDFFIDFYLF